MSVEKRHRYSCEWEDSKVETKEPEENIKVGLFFIRWWSDCTRRDGHLYPSGIMCLGYVLASLWRGAYRVLPVVS